MESILIYVLFAVGIVLIVKGGDWFVDGAVWAAEITRIPKFIIGATIISVATTLPEIFVSTIAAMEDTAFWCPRWATTSRRHRTRWAWPSATASAPSSATPP